MEMEAETSASASASARELAQRPGFLIRRLHQIYVALFARECAEFDITPVQHSLLSVIMARPGLDQCQIGEAAGIDRAMLVKEIARLEATGLLKRITSRLDRRQKVLALTPQGETLLSQMQASVGRADARTIAALEPGARAVFMECLGRLVNAEGDARKASPRLK